MKPPQKPITRSQHLIPRGHRYKTPKPPVMEQYHSFADYGNPPPVARESEILMAPVPVAKTGLFHSIQNLVLGCFRWILAAIFCNRVSAENAFENDPLLNYTSPPVSFRTITSQASSRDVNCDRDTVISILSYAGFYDTSSQGSTVRESYDNRTGHVDRGYDTGEVTDCTASPVDSVEVGEHSVWVAEDGLAPFDGSESDGEHYVYGLQSPMGRRRV